MTNNAPRLIVEAIELYERPVQLRLPFRFGVVTLTECPQAFVRVRVASTDGRPAWGAAAGTTDTLERILRDIVPGCDPETFVWAACEQKQARAIRTFVKSGLARDPGTFSIAAYWQR